MPIAQNRTNSGRTRTPLTLTNQKFGVEIEFTGITRARAISILRQVLGGRDVNPFTVSDRTGRNWLIKYDGSVRTENGGDANELVTPILTYEDMDTLQEIVRKLKEAGGKANSSCGIHIHVASKPHSVRSTRNFVRLFANTEDLLYTALGVHSSRAESYCLKLRRNHSSLLTRLNTFERAIDIASYFSRNSYSNSKYTGLNLNKITNCGKERGTFEFRLFNSTLHAGKVRAYIVLSLMMSAYSYNTNTIESYPVVENRTSMENFLAQLNISRTDNVTKNVYKHLMKNFEDSTENRRRAS